MPGISSVPPSTNYASPLVAVPCVSGNEPDEGRKMVQCEIDWGTMGGPNNSVNVNFQNNAQLDFSQIVSLAVDNSQCGSDVTFVFPDTAETVTIPAYSPHSVVPVFTNQRQFFVVAIGPRVLSNDITRFSVLNFVPPPVSVPTSQEQNVSAITTIDATVVAATQLIPATVSGTIEDTYITIQTQGSGSTALTGDIEDGTGKLLGVWHVNAGIAGILPLLALYGVALRFSQGLKLNITATAMGPNATISSNVYYRTP